MCKNVRKYFRIRIRPQHPDPDLQPWYPSVGNIRGEIFFFKMVRYLGPRAQGPKSWIVYILVANVFCSLNYDCLQIRIGPKV